MDQKITLHGLSLTMYIRRFRHCSFINSFQSTFIDGLSFKNDRVKVKYTPVQALRLCTGRTAHTGSRRIVLPSLDHGIRRGERSGSRSVRFLSPGKTRYPLYRRLGGPQDRSGHLRKISPPPGFGLQTVQPVAIRYTEYATRPTKMIERWKEFWQHGSLKALQLSIIGERKRSPNVTVNASVVAGTMWEISWTAL